MGIIKFSESIISSIGKNIEKHTYRYSFCMIALGMASIAYSFFVVSQASNSLNKKSEEYNESYNEFINHADQDNNRYISIQEQTEAWKKLGFEGPFYESKGKSQFPKPDLSQLEKAIESYNQK